MAAPSDLSDVPAWPVVAIDLSTDGRVRVDDETIVVPVGADMRRTAVEAVAATAALIGRPVRAEAREPDGTVWPLVVTPEGEVLSAGSGRPPPPTARRRGFRSGVLRRAAPEPPTGPPPLTAPLATPPTAEPATPSADPPGPPTIPPPPPAPGRLGEPVPPAGPPERDSGRGTSSVSPPPYARPSLPEPDAETRLALGRILSELRLGRFASARSRAQILVDRLAGEHGRTDAATAAAGEVLAYTTFVAGAPARAAGLYVDLARPYVDGSAPVGVHGTRLADNAQFCWSRIGNSPDAQELGSRVLDLRTTGWGADSAQSRTVRRRLGDPGAARAEPGV